MTITITITELVEEVLSVYPATGSQPTLNSVANVIRDYGVDNVDEYVFGVVDALPRYRR
jgi:hypothetical protein